MNIEKRSFGGIISKNIIDFYSDEAKENYISWLDTPEGMDKIKEANESAKVNRSFHDKMLKAYLKGHEYFNFGYIGRDRMGVLIPNRFAVLVNS